MVTRIINKFSVVFIRPGIPVYLYVGTDASGEQKKLFGISFDYARAVKTIRVQRI